MKKANNMLCELLSPSNIVKGAALIGCVIVLAEPVLNWFGYLFCVLLVKRGNR